MAFLRELFAVSGFFPLFFSPAAMSAGPAAVEAVKSPAWLDRGGRKMPPAAGMDLQSGDVVRTGSGARAYLMFAEGSRVKLGDPAQFTFYTQSLRQGNPVAARSIFSWQPFASPPPT